MHLLPRALVVFILALGLVLMALPATADDRLEQREVFGFLPYWELGRSDGIDLDTLTTLAWFGVEAGRDGRLVRETPEGELTPGWAGWTSEEFAALRERAQAAGVRVVLTIEQFSWSEAGRRETKKLLSDPAARAMLAREITDSVTAAGADGVNLDFEPLPRSSRGDFVQLVRKVRRVLDTADPSLQLTFDLTPDVTSFPLKRLVAEGAADAAVLMGYEYRTPGSKVAGSVAPLRDPDGLDVRDSVERAVSRAPAERVILAMPWYGRAWSTRTAEVGARTRRSDRFLASSTAFYRVSVPRAASAGRLYDAKQASAWSVYGSQACETCPLSPRQLWYDDVDSVRAKVGLARRKGLRGVGIWALGYEGERTELWSALRYAMDRPQDEIAPVGTARISGESVLGQRDELPVVGETVTLELSAMDGIGGSGVAFVRVARRGQVGEDGELKRGTTYPAVESVSVTMPDVDPADEVFAPDVVSPSPEPASDEVLAEPGVVAIRVQWRDIAGNWSAPVTLRAYFDPGAGAASVADGGLSQ